MAHFIGKGIMIKGRINIFFEEMGLVLMEGCEVRVFIGWMPRWIGKLIFLLAIIKAIGIMRIGFWGLVIFVYANFPFASIVLGEMMCFFVGGRVEFGFGGENFPILLGLASIGGGRLDLRSVFPLVIKAERKLRF